MNKRVFPLNPKYQVSDCGRVFKGSKELKQTKIPEGYLSVTMLDASGYGKKYRVHRLVAMCFIECDNPDRIEVNHIDYDRSNNHVSNLEWVTRRENHDHSKHRMWTYKGEESPSSKLTDKDVLDIFNATDSYRSIAKKFGVSEGTVSGIKTGRNWSHLTRKKYNNLGKDWKRKIVIEDEKDLAYGKYTAKEFMSKFGVSNSTVCRIRKKYKVDAPKVNLVEVKLTDPKDGKEYRLGSLKQAAAFLGKSINHIVYYSGRVNKEGWKIEKYNVS